MDYLGQLSPDASVQVIIEDVSGKRIADTTISDVTTCSDIPGGISGQIVVSERADLWWPVGYGAQPLHNITMRIRDGNGNALATVFKRTGFRTIVLDQRSITGAEIVLGIAPGSRWNFEIDGHEIFCKGSIMVLPDAF